MIDYLKKLWESAKPYAVNFVVRWLLKVASGPLLLTGWTEDNIALFVGGILSLVVGIIFSLIQNKKVLFTPPPSP